jgi:hypothetical protein
MGQKTYMYGRFQDLYPVIIECLSSIVENSDRKWDAKATTDANGLLSNITSPSFIAAFTVNMFIFGFTKPLSKLLQIVAIEVVQAYPKIERLKNLLLTIRGDSAKEFKKVFSRM